jgi:hypothetical protein
MDTRPTYAMEVQPGTRLVHTKLDIYGPGGNEKFKEGTRLTLEPGKVYFLRPDCEAMKSKRFLLKVEALPEPYNAEVRTRLINWKRQRVKGKFIAD